MSELYFYKMFFLIETLLKKNRKAVIVLYPSTELWGLYKIYINFDLLAEVLGFARKEHLIFKLNQYNLNE